MSNTHSNEFYNLIRAIGETKSKQEEDKIITKEIATLKQHFENIRKTPNQAKQIREYLIRMIYCELLGHDAGFGYFFAVTATSSKLLPEKRMGYLAAALCMPNDHELALLLTHNMQKDLASTNYLEIASALNAASKMLTEETIPALLPKAIDLLKSQFPLVRKKVFMFIHSTYSLYPNLVSNPLQHARTGLSDHDPCVMGAALCLLHEIALRESEITETKLFAQSLVSILRQILEHRLHNSYDYHRLPAPWMQMKILSILAILGKDDKPNSQLMYEVLKEVIRRADIGLNIGHAVVYQTIRTITSIYPEPSLLEIAATATSRFISSKNHNLKYLGIQALTQIVQINPKYANQHQDAVIECLEDRDETLKRSTLSLLYTMTNAPRVTIITNKLMEFAKKEIDKTFQRELIAQICSLAEKFAPDNFWYVDTLNDCFEVDAALVPKPVIQTLITVIAEGSGEDAQADEELRIYCVDHYFELLQTKAVIHDIHLQVIAWVLGEYGYLSKKYSKKVIIGVLCDMAERRLDETYTRSCIFSALSKLIAHIGGEPQSQAEEIVEKYKCSRNVDLQQRSHEFLSLMSLNNPGLLQELFPFDGSCEEIEVDENLSFAQRFVDQALARGKRPYLAEGDRDFEEVRFEKPQLKIEHMEAPPDLSQKYANLNPYNREPVKSESHSSVDTSMPHASLYPTKSNSTDESNNDLFKNSRVVWFDEDDEPPTLPTPASSKPASVDRSSVGSSSPMGIGSNQSFGSANISKSSPAGMGSNDFQSNDYNPPPPRRIQEDDQKKPSKKTTQFVSSLFADGGSSRAPGRSPKPAQKKPRPKVTQEQLNIFEDEKPEKRPQVQQESNDLLSLDDFLIDETSETSSNHTQTQPSNKSPPKTTSPPKNEKKSFSLPKESKPSSFSSQPTQPSKSNDIDPFDDFLGESTNNSGSVIDDDSLFSTDQPYTLSSGPSPSILSQLENLRGVHPDHISICRDSYLGIWEQRYYGENDFIILLTLKTERGYKLTNVDFSLQPPAKFDMELSTDLDASLYQLRGNSISFKYLEPASPIQVILKFSLKGHGFGLSIMGMISYSDDQRKRRSNNFSVKLSVLDVLRPNSSMTVQDFSKAWKTHSREKRVVLKKDISLDALKDFVAKKLNLSVIQCIDQELIAGGRVMDLQSTLILHAKLVPQNQSVILTVRSNDPTLSSLMANVASVESE